MMKFHLYCLFLFLSLSAFAQEPKPALVRFTGPAKSVEGLKSSDGKEVWKAEFTDLQQRGHMINGIVYFFWTAKKNGLYGALDDAGKVIIPFEFEQLKFSDMGYFIVKAGNEMLIYSFFGERKYSVTGIDIIHVYNYGFIIEKNGKQGFIDPEFKRQIPIQFEYIEPKVLRMPYDSNYPEYSSHIFSVYEGERWGIYDLKRGLIIPPRYIEVEANWVDSDCEHSEAVYEAAQPDMRYVINSEGKIMDSVEIITRLEFYSVQRDSCRGSFYSFALIALQQEIDGMLEIVETRIIDLLSGKNLGPYDREEWMEHRILRRKDKRQLPYEKAGKN